MVQFVFVSCGCLFYESRQLVRDLGNGWSLLVRQFQLPEDPELEDLYAVYRSYWSKRGSEVEEDAGDECEENQEDNHVEECEEEEAIEDDPYAEDFKDDDDANLHDAELGAKLGLAMSQPSATSKPVQSLPPSTKPSSPKKASQPVKEIIPQETEDEQLRRAERLARIATLKLFDSNMRYTKISLQGMLQIQSTLAIPGKRLLRARAPLLPRRRLEEPPQPGVLGLASHF